MKNLVRYVRRLLRTAVGRDLSPRLDCRFPSNTFGSGYGGWELVHSRLDGKSVVYSFGVGEDLSFEFDLINRFGMEVHAFDPTPKSVRWAKLQVKPASLIFHEYGLADLDGEIEFCPPVNSGHVSYTMLGRPSTASCALNLPVKRISTIVSLLGHQRIDVLKMDIEGAEYCVISDLVKTGIRPLQICVEFHHRFAGVGVQMTRKALCQLRNIGYGLYSLSSSGEEYSFIYLG